MLQRPVKSTLILTLFPYTTPFRSASCRYLPDGVAASYGINASGSGSITITGGTVVAKGETGAAYSAATSDGSTALTPLTGAHDATFAVWGPADTYYVIDSAVNGNALSSDAVGLDFTANVTSSDRWDSTHNRGWKWDYDENGSTLTLENVIINVDTQGLTSSSAQSNFQPTQP